MNTTTIRRATAAAVITLIVIAAVTIGWYGLTKAWGNGDICDHGVTHHFDNEQTYYAYLGAHPEATEGTCQPNTTTTAPASTVSPTTSADVTTTSTAGSTTSNPPDTTSASSGPSTSNDSTTSTAATVPCETGSQEPRCNQLPPICQIYPDICNRPTTTTTTPSIPTEPATAERGPQHPIPDQDADDRCVNGRTLIHFLPCTNDTAAAPVSDTPPPGTLPVTGGPSPHDLLWGVGFVLVGLALVRIGMRRRPS